MVYPFVADEISKQILYKITKIAVKSALSTVVPRQKRQSADIPALPFGSIAYRRRGIGLRLRIII